MTALLWIPATLIAAAAQTARNATQAGLTASLGTIGATQVRFLFGLPFAILFLGLVVWSTGERPPAITPRSAGFIVLGALAQIGATALMLRAMAERSFAVTTAWIKTEPVMVALVAAAVLGDPLTLTALAGIAIATLGVIVVSLRPGSGGQMFHDIRPAAMGLLAGLLFGLAAIGFRGGILAFPTGGFLIRATTALVLSLAVQSFVLLIWLLRYDRPALRASLGLWRPSLGAGFLGALASQFWFIAFALTTAANVRTLALVEVLFAQAVSRYAFRQAVSLRQKIGMALIVAGVAVLLRDQV